MHLSLFTTFCPPIFWFAYPIFLTSLRQCLYMFKPSWRIQSFFRGSQIRGGSRHSTREGTNLICFSVSHVNFFVGGGAKVYNQTGWGTMAAFSSPVDSPLLKSTGAYTTLIHFLDYHKGLEEGIAIPRFLDGGIVGSWGLYEILLYNIQYMYPIMYIVQEYEMRTISKGG